MCNTQAEAIIDLDSSLVLPFDHQQPVQSKRRDFQWQQWQLFSVIAFVCDFQAQRQQAEKDRLVSPSLMACVNSKPLHGLDPQKTYKSLFERCNFKKSMLWTDDMLNHTEATYDALADWCGLTL